MPCCFREKSLVCKFAWVITCSTTHALETIDRHGTLPQQNSLSQPSVTDDYRQWKLFQRFVDFSSREDNPHRGANRIIEPQLTNTSERLQANRSASFPLLAHQESLPDSAELLHDSDNQFVAY